MRKLWTFRCIALVLCMALAFAALEIFCRIRYRPHTPSGWDLVNRMEAHPYTMLHYHKNVHSAEVNTNNLGYRATADYPLYPMDAPPKDRFTVVLLGGSAAFGAKSDNDRSTIAADLEKDLSRTRPTRVVNLAMGGYGSFAELIAFTRYGLLFQPDVVITMDGYNDAVALIYPNSREQPGDPIQYNSVAKAVAAYWPYGFRFTDDYYLAFLLKQSALLRRLAMAEYTSWDNVPGEKERRSRITAITAAQADRLVDSYQHAQTQLVRVAAANGVKTIIATQPLRDYPGVVEEPWRQELFKIYPRLIETARQTAEREHAAAYVDLTQFFPPPNAQTFADTVHLTSPGQAIIAQKLASAVEKYIFHN